MQKAQIQEKIAEPDKIAESKFKRYSFLLYGIVVGTIFDIFFYNKTMGISYPVFIIIIMGVFSLLQLALYMLFWPAPPNMPNHIFIRSCFNSNCLLNQSVE